MTDYEKLGAFYLGRTVDPETADIRDELAALRRQGPDDPRRLRRHDRQRQDRARASALLEEAAIDGIPAIAIDPKGDLGNLLLTFPELRPADFRPWIDPGEAARKGGRRTSTRSWTAELWRKGLAEWGQDGARIARLRDAVDVCDLHAGQQRRAAARRAALLRRAPAGRCRRRRRAARADPLRGVRAARAARRRRRSRAEPRAHPALDHPATARGAKGATSTSRR